MKKMLFICAVVLLLMTAGSCGRLEDRNEGNGQEVEIPYVGLDEVAEILSGLPLQKEHLAEVHDAVSSSSGNGYDEEYTMRHLFGNPGAGVGESAVADVRSETEYARPLRELIDEYVRSKALTRTSGDGMSPDAFLDAIERSDMQIYWPFSENWDGEEMPVITFDPEDGSEVNIGYRFVTEDDGTRRVQEVEVDEEMAEEVPVWVVNRNSDAGYVSLEMLRREDPEWGEGGGAIIVKPGISGAGQTKAGGTVRTLVLKDFTMNRNYDSWFAGASEFFVKIGYLDGFTASTEAEMKLYSPMITDFMIVVKRSQVGIPQPFNAILLTDWTGQMESCAFMITEDDGGTQTEWTTKAKVFVAGKSYGVEVTLPLNVRDDIVWRGQLMSSWIEKYDAVRSPFGDVDLTFGILED